MKLRQKQIQVQVNRMRKTIMDEIRQVIVEYARKEGLRAVIDSSNRQAAVGVFVYVHPDADISEEILMVLNSQRPDLAEEDDGAAQNEMTEENAQKQEAGNEK